MYLTLSSLRHGGNLFVLLQQAPARFINSTHALSDILIRYGHGMIGSTALATWLPEDSRFYETEGVPKSQKRLRAELWRASLQVGESLLE